jgi:hypothetical protein
MGMVLGLMRLRDETIERLIADPPPRVEGRRAPGGVYLDPLWARGESSDDPLEYLMVHVATLRETLSKAAAQRHGLLITLS